MEGNPNVTEPATGQEGGWIPVPGRSPLPPIRLKKRRSPPPGTRKSRLRAPELSIPQILEWADAHHRLTGEWPTADSGWLLEGPREKWFNISQALRMGGRGLAPGSSLARLLAAERGVPNRKGRPTLSVEEILSWADAHFERTGAWPHSSSGRVQVEDAEQPEETWLAIDVALRNAIRGLPGGSSLSQLLAEHRGVRNRASLAPLHGEQILAWADAYHARHGRWPHAGAERVADDPDNTWLGVNQALKNGLRGLPGGSSLPRLLQERRGVPNRLSLPRLEVAQILAWADAHFTRTGRWPNRRSGCVHEAPDETWGKLHAALSAGNRGLPPGSSLPQLLLEERGVEHHLARPRLSEAQILEWMDAYHNRHGRWPTHESGEVEGVPGATWSNMDHALRAGLRGLKKGSSVALLLARARDVRNQTSLPPLTEEQILRWADGFFVRNQRWPKADDGPVLEALNENWNALSMALNKGCRGLPGGTTLARLLLAQRDSNQRVRGGPLTEEQILAWADAFYARTGDWPRNSSGRLEDAPGQTWSSLDAALRDGRRGLPGESSLVRLLEEHRGRWNAKNQPRLTEAQVLAWADAHFAATGSWPRKDSGAVSGTPGEDWRRIHDALRAGSRGLPGSSSLARLLQEHRGVRNRKALSPFTETGIQEWVRAYRAREGRWPTAMSGPIPEAPGESWNAVACALRSGIRGMPGGSSLRAFTEALEEGLARGGAMSAA